MKVYIDTFLDYPTSKRILISFLFLGIILAIFYFLALKPIEDTIEAEQVLITSLQSEIQGLKYKASKLQEFEEEVERLDIELSKALKELPDRKEIDTLLAKIFDKAKESGLDVILFKPEEQIKKDFYAEVPVSLEMRGGFHQVASFFDEVSHLDRIVNMNQIKLSLSNDKNKEGSSPDNLALNNLTVAVVATSYRFLDETERPQEEEKKSSRRKKDKSKK